MSRVRTDVEDMPGVVKSGIRAAMRDVLESVTPRAKIDADGPARESRRRLASRASTHVRVTD